MPPKTLGGHGHLYVKASRVAGVNQSTVGDQRGGLCKALRADAEVVALGVINAGKPLGHIPNDCFGNGFGTLARRCETRTYVRRRAIIECPRGDASVGPHSMLTV